MSTGTGHDDPVREAETIYANAEAAHRAALRRRHPGLTPSPDEAATLARLARDVDTARAQLLDALNPQGEDLPTPHA